MPVNSKWPIIDIHVYVTEEKKGSIWNTHINKCSKASNESKKVKGKSPTVRKCIYISANNIQKQTY